MSTISSRGRWGARGGRAAWSIGILCIVVLSAVRCAPDETINPLDPTAALGATNNSKGWGWWKQTLTIDPDSAIILGAGDTVRLTAILSSAWKENEPPTLVEADWFLLDPEVVENEGSTTSARTVLLRGREQGTARVVAIYDGLAALARVSVGEGDPGEPEPVPVAATVSDRDPVLLVGDAITLRPELLDEDDEVISTQPSEWSTDFDPAFVSVSAQFVVTAQEPTPPGSSTIVVFTHVETELAVDAEIVILPESEPGEWPDNEPPGMTTVLMVDGSSKAWPGFAQGGPWTDDNRVTVVSDPRSKYGQAIEKRFVVGDDSGWNGITYNGTHIVFGELYFRIVFRLSSNWQWHQAGGKYFYYGAAGRRGGAGPTQFILSWSGSGRTRWIDFSIGSGAYEANDAPPITRDVYHTIEIHHVASTSGPNGSLRMWIDGVEVESFNAIGDETQNDIQLTNREWVGTRGFEDKRLGRGLQAFMFWGGQEDTKQVNDWVRLSEFYVSGRN